MSKPTVIVTGASGLLGRAVFQALQNDFNVIGTAFSRSNGSLLKLDITNHEKIKQFIDTHKPVAVIQCAAERRPDVAEKNKDGAHIINVTAAGWVAEECKRIGAFFVYISTDYVFDGKNPPYEVDSAPCPINYYGQSKWEGEQACLTSNPDAVIFRVPILYGAVEYHEESAVNCLVPIILNGSKKVTMDDFQVRYPTNVADAANALSLLTAKALADKNVKGIYHFCAKEKVTKYEMCKVIAEALGGVDISHLEPLRDVPLEALANRPYNAQLSNKRIEEDAGIRVECVPFRTWWVENAKK
ncbi:UNVERIFIED_CONTAM: Methionine adenosyltransferase 2 subunit beta [Siphonaria sp. JEL0065]|nr:Methionine adenosyltransferase 2 subunit beta [Siphonaria sp. JEL0065]